MSEKSLTHSEILSKVRSLNITEARKNGLDGLLDGVFDAFRQQGAQTHTSTTALANNLTYVPLSINRPLLTYSYTGQGIVRTCVDMPVEDAFSSSFKLRIPELSNEEVDTLMSELKRPRSQYYFGSQQFNPKSFNVHKAGIMSSGPSDIDHVIQMIKWKRLYGGAGLIVNTDQDFRKSFNPDKITKDSPLEFISADRWELIMQAVNVFDPANVTPFNYYGHPVHRSRVAIFNGTEAPAYFRPRLQGWGMSVLEGSLPAVDAFVKFENFIFEMMDEAKIDVYKVEGYNAAMGSSLGEEKMNYRIWLANQAKSVHGCIVMDKTDEYTQKTFSFTGLADIWNEVRRNLAAYLRIPMNKLFGESASGFGSGADSLENYGQVIKSVQADAEIALRIVISLRCQQLFGIIPEILEVQFGPVQILSGLDAEQVKAARQTRILERFNLGLQTAQEVMEELQQEGVTTYSTEVLRGERDVAPPSEKEESKSQGGIKDAFGKKGDNRDKERSMKKDHRER